MDKYYYILTTLNKQKILSRGNDDKKTKNVAENQIIKKWENIYIIRLKIKKISDKDLEENKQSKIKTIGGHIKIIITFYIIEGNNIIELKDFVLNNNIYIENEDLTDKNLKLIAKLTINKKLSNKLFVINTLDKYIIKKDIVFWFRIKKDKNILLSKGYNIDIANKNLLDKMYKKPEKYINLNLWRLTINNNPDDTINYGEKYIYVQNYKVVELDDLIKVKLEPEKGKIGKIWFKKNWLEYNKFNNNNIIINIVNKLTSNVNIKLTAPNIYHLLF